jgi:hypothetical protein
MKNATPYAFIIDLSNDRLLRCVSSGSGSNTVETFTAPAGCQSCGGAVRYAYWPECCEPLGNVAHCLGCFARVVLVEPTNPDFPAWRNPG